MPIPIALPQEGVSVAGDPLGAFPLHRLAQVQGEHRGQAALLDCAEPHRPRRPGLLHRPEDLERRSSPRMRKSVADFGPARPFGLSACGSSPRDCRHDPVHQHSPRPVRGRVDLPHPSVQDALRLLASWAATSTDDIQQPAVIDDAEQAEASRRPTDQVNLDEPPRGTAPRPCSAQRAPRTRNTGRLRWSCSSIWSTSSPPRSSPPYMAYERRLHRGASGRDPDGGGVDAHGDAPGPRDLRAGVRRHPRRGLSSTASLAWRRHSRLKTRRRNEAAIAKLPWPTDRS